MKQRKQKVHGNKKAQITFEETRHYEMSELGMKNPSGHTKLSTNWTIHSNAGSHPPHEKRSKSKKNGRSGTK